MTANDEADLIRRMEALERWTAQYLRDSASRDKTFGEFWEQLDQADPGLRPAVRAYIRNGPSRSQDLWDAAYSLEHTLDASGLMVDARDMDRTLREGPRDDHYH